MSQGTAPIIEYLARSRDVFDAALGDPRLVETVAAIVDRVAAALAAGHKLLLAGNGGSAADAQHLAAELVVRLRGDRPGLPALALTTNTSVLTAASNDYGFEQVFARQVESLVLPGDVLVALSTSGTSSNIISGVEAGRRREAFLVGLTGEAGGALAGKVDLLLNVPSRDPQRIQEAHITIGHIVCALIEQIRFGEAGSRASGKAATNPGY